MTFSQQIFVFSREASILHKSTTNDIVKSLLILPALRFFFLIHKRTAVTFAVIHTKNDY